MQSNINSECSIKFVLNYRELKANSISICVLKYRILHKFKENIKVLKFNSKSFSHDAQNYKTSTLLELKHIFVCLLVFFFFKLYSKTCGILFPWPRFKLVFTALGVQSLNHRATREVPQTNFIYSSCAWRIKPFPHLCPLPSLSASVSK